MKRTWKRRLAGLLAAVMLLTTLSGQAYAAVGELAGNSAVENAALLEALKEAYGEDEETYLALLDYYGLLDEDGNLITDAAITMEGKKYTLEEMEDYLSRPGVDLSEMVEVEGSYTTLENLKKILEIEKYLAYVKAEYFSPTQATGEQMAGARDFASALVNGQVNFLAENGLEEKGPSGIDHGVRLTVDAAKTASVGGDYTITVTPTKPQSQPITFSWRALSGSAQVSGGGKVTIPAGSTDPVELPVSVTGTNGQVNGSASFVVQLYDAENALFVETGTDRWEQVVTVTQKTSFKYQDTVEGTLSYAGDYYSSGQDLRMNQIICFAFQRRLPTPSCKSYVDIIC